MAAVGSHIDSSQFFITTGVRNLHVPPARDDGFISASCTTIGGEEMTRTKVEPATPLQTVLSTLAAQMRELDGSPLRFMFPDGRVLAEQDTSLPIERFVQSDI